MVLPGNVCRVRDRPFFKQTALSSGSGEAPRLCTYIFAITVRHSEFCEASMLLCSTSIP
jgi:hypothetical protein